MQRVFGENGEFNRHVSEIEMPRIAEEAGKNWEKFFAGMGEMYKPAWQKQIGFTEREKMDIGINVKTKTTLGGLAVKGANSYLNTTYGVTTKVNNKLGNSFVGKQVSSMSVMDIAKAANTVGGTALKSACPMAFWVGPAIESSLMIFDTLGSKGYYGDNMSTGQLVTGLLASQLTPAIGMIPGVNGAGNVLAAVGKAQGGMLINYQLDNLGQAIDFREENGKGSLIKASTAQKMGTLSDSFKEKTGRSIIHTEERKTLERRANSDSSDFKGTKFDTKSFVIQSGTAAASAGISSSYAGADGMFASDLGSAMFNSVAGYGMNLGLNTANKYVDAAWDVTEKNKGIKKGAYSASVKDVNKDLKKQKVADLAGVNILGLLESLGSAAAADGIESKARNSLAEDGYSGADSRRLAKEQRSLESKGESSENAKKAVVNKEKAIKTWENNGYSRKDAEKMYAVSGQDFDTMQMAHNEEKRKQEEDAARLANAGKAVLPDEQQKKVKGSGRITQDKDGNSIDENGNRVHLLASVGNMMLTDIGTGGVLDASGLTMEEMQQARLIAGATKNETENKTYKVGDEKGTQQIAKKHLEEKLNRPVSPAEVARYAKEIAQENNLKNNKSGDPIIKQGQKLNLPDTDDYKTLDDYKKDYTDNRTKNIEIIARTVYGEGRGSSEEFQKLVTNTILRRSYSGGEFGGETPEEVATHKAYIKKAGKDVYAFSAWDPKLKDKNLEAVQKEYKTDARYKDILELVTKEYDAYTPGQKKDKEGNLMPTHYYSPEAMKPKGTIPAWNWSKLKKIYEIKNLNDENKFDGYFYYQMR